MKSLERTCGSFVWCEHEVYAAMRSLIIEYTEKGSCDSCFVCDKRHNVCLPGL
jgi:hypothetical protein